VGEFSFVLAKAGVAQGLFGGAAYQLFLDVTILTMVATPLIMAQAPRIAAFTMRMPWPQRLKHGSHLPTDIGPRVPRDHLIIVGFGMNGRNLARAANSAGIPYVVIEMNPETVRREREKGKPIFFGDATQEEILQHANIAEARIVVVAINDPSAVRRITSLARRLNSKVHIIVRTRYVNELQPLFKLGADDVIPEEFETSVEIFTLVLKKYLVPKDEIERLTSEVRANCYMLFRGLFKELQTYTPLRRQLHDVDISTFRLEEGAPLAGKSLAQMELRKKHGVTVLAVRRNSQVFHNPDPDMTLLAGDLLISIGSPDDLIKVTGLFTQPPAREPHYNMKIGERQGDS